VAEKLTPQQQLAVDDRGGNLLVSAAAGSGKTKVLVDRLLKYIKDPVDPANIDEFLIITYTKAAAAELRSKIASKLSEHIAQEPGNRHLQRQLQRLYLTKISTVHSFCADILREYAYLLDISGDFRVADEYEVLQLRIRAMDQILEDAYQNIDNDPDLQAFVDTQGVGRSDSQVPEIILQVYGSAMCHIDPAAWCRSCVENAQLVGISDPIQTVWGRYLVDDLFACLDDQIQVSIACAEAVEGIAGLEKPAALLRDTVYQLQHLRQSTTWDEILQRKQIEYGRLVFPKKADDPAVTEPVKAVRNASKKLLAKKLKVFADPSNQVLSDLAQSAAAARGLMALVEKFKQRFDRMKRQRRVLDFSDLEHKTLDLLLGKSRSGPTAAAQEISRRFREIMVDEYQDSNGVQDAIFSAITKNNLFMVGDVKQSIYQFRLADPGIFLEKYASFVPAGAADPGLGRKVLLSSNFRSGGGVIEAANHVFFTCMSQAVGGIDYGEAEALREGVPHRPLPEPEVELYGIRVQEDTYAEEAAFVAERICQLTDGSHMVRQGDDFRPIVMDDIVILLRSPGPVAVEYIDALQQRGIRCASGAGSDLLLEPEVATLRSILQVISNPRQDIPLLATLASPVFGFTADDLAQLRSSNRNCCIYDALKHSPMPAAQQFLETLYTLRRTAAMASLPEILSKIFNLTRLDTIYASMTGGAAARENLQQFYQLAADFSHSGGDLDRFLTHLEMLEQKGVASGSQESSAGCVTIMSIHKSKGLEFPVVFLCGLSKRFNQQDLHDPVLCHKELGLGLSCMDEANRVRYPTLSKSAIAARMLSDSISEEMRVLYVGMTRSKDRLIMTYASDSLEKDIKDIALRMDICGREAMTRNVGNPGKWVLYSALKRTEAGAFFDIGAKPNSSAVFDRPWLIRVCDGFIFEDTAISQEDTKDTALPDAAIENLQQALSFRYCYQNATVTPSKQTATQRKGRTKDREAAEYAVEPKHLTRTWRQPSFLSDQADPTAYGTAVHAALQHIRYSACDSVQGVRDELDRMCREGLLTQEHAKQIYAPSIAAFFQTPMGQKLMNSQNVLREFKFSILDDAEDYAADLEGEKVLLQGVVDCALLESDGITVIDFKTDYVTDKTVDAVTAHYAPQVHTYAMALERIYQMPVKAKALYYFRLGRFVWL